MDINIDLLHKLFFPLHSHVGEDGKIMYTEEDLAKVFGDMAEEMYKAAKNTMTEEHLIGGTNSKYFVGTHVILKLLHEYFAHKYSEDQVNWYKNQ